MTVIVAVAVALCGGVGALARYLLDGSVQSRTSGVFPWGTLVVNVAGSFLLGAFTGLAWYHHLGGDASRVLDTGLCGGFTTWSTASWQTVRLLESGLLKQAGLQAVAGLCLALAAAAMGMGLAAL